MADLFVSPARACELFCSGYYLLSINTAILLFEGVECVRMTSAFIRTYERESYLSHGVLCLGSKLRVSTFLPFFRDISHMCLNPLLRAK